MILLTSGTVSAFVLLSSLGVASPTNSNNLSVGMYSLIVFSFVVKIEVAKVHDASNLHEERVSSGIG